MGSVSTGENAPIHNAGMSLPPGFHWEPNDRVAGNFWLFRDRGMLVVGSVCRRLDGLWLSYIDRHRWRDRHAIAPTRETAMRWAERWCWARAGALATAEPERMPGSPEPIRTFRPPAQKPHGYVRPNDPLIGITIPALGLDE